MGFYIQAPSNHGKDEFLVQSEGAIRLSGPAEARQAMTEGFGIVCVMDNGAFEAAGFAFSDEELEAFADPRDSRPKVWLAMDRSRAEVLSGYSESGIRRGA